MRMQAVFHGVVVAESDETVVVEGNHYFPAGSVRREHLVPSATTSRCPWKGKASYWTVEIDGDTAPDAAWYYARPSPLARRVADHVAFWHGVEVRPAPVPPAGTVEP